MAAKLIELGISSISVERQKKGTLTMEQHVFDAASFSRHGGRHAPTLAELKAELMAYLAAHPGMNRTEVSKLFTAHGHELIYTPPYQPGVQPIERLWAYVAAQRGAEMLPFCMETCGGMAPAALQLLKILGEAGQEHLAMWPGGDVIRHLVGSVAVAVQRGSADAYLDGYARALARME
jgi:hypothetical protein